MKLFVIPVLIFLIAVCAAPAQAEANIEFPLYVNVGGSTAYTTDSGITYLADQPWSENLSYGYVKGSVVTIDSPIGGTLDQSLYATQRSGIEQFLVGGVPSGDYVLSLHFAELNNHRADATVFDVIVEGQLALDDFDPFSAAQLNREYAVVHRTLVTVSDGLLEIRFTPSSGRAQLAAVSMVPYVPTDPDLPPPAGLHTIPSFEATILDWDDVDADDVAGYHIFRSPSENGPYTRLSDEPALLSRFIDLFEIDTPLLSSTEPMTKPSANNWFYAVATVSVNGVLGELGAPVAGQPLSVDDTTLPVYHLDISSENLAKLSPDVNDNSLYPATLTYEGSEYDVDVRYRGQFTRKYAKKSWKVVFNGDSPFSNRNEVDLKSHYDDLTLIRGMLTTQIYKKLGINPPEARHALLFVNGEYYGVYTDYERVDESFLTRTGRNANSTIYETLFTNQWNYGQTLKTEEYPVAYKVRTNKHLGYYPIQNFIESVNLTPRQFFTQSLERVFNVRNYLKYYAGIIFTGNTDFTHHNVFLVNDPDADLWEVVPWDPDLTWGNGGGFSLSYASNMEINAGTFGGPTVLHGPNVFLTQVIGQPQYRAYYCEQLRTISDESFISSEIFPLIDGYHDRIRVAAYADWRKFGWEEHTEFDRSKDALKTFATERGEFLRARLDAFCPVPTSLLTINEVAAGTQTVFCDPDEGSPIGCNEQWLEIHNPTLETVDLQGMYLTNDLAIPNKFRFDQSVTIPPGSQVIVWLDNEPLQGANHANFTLAPENRSVALVAADGSTVFDELEITARGHDIYVQRYPDGNSTTYVVGALEASPEGTNHLAARIRSVSATPSEPDANEEVEIKVSLFPENEFVEGTLHYRVNGSSQAVELERRGYGQFVGLIPAQADETHVEYYLTVQGHRGEDVSPASALNEGGFHQYLVGYEKPLIKINEVRANQDSGVLSWFELYNDENFAVDISGMFLTNDVNEPRKYQIPDDLPMIQPGGFTVFYANATPTLSSQHTNFVLTERDGTIALYDRDETYNQPISTFSYESVPTFGAYQRCTNNNSIWLITTSPTPGYNNSPACKIIYLPLH